MKKKVIAILAVILILSAWAGWKFFGPSVSTASGEFFYVKTGSTYADIRDDLVSKKYIKNGPWFGLAAKILHYNKIKPGRYKIAKDMSLFNLIKMLRSGDQTQVSFVITKIRTREDMARKAGMMFEFDSLTMIRFLDNPDSLQRFNLDTNTVTAAIMPFTYSLNWNSTPGKLFQKCYNAYVHFWTGERKIKADSLQMTPVQVATLASIVEEETRKKEDKYNIASTYLNRLRIGMRLQADPTIKFALKDFGLKRILSVHLATLSPYNTYLNAGLPPGPICTPSIESIDAVLNAPKTDYLYFVASSKFDGSSVFTSNLTDHMKHAREYQQELTRRMDSARKNNPK